MKTLSLYDAFYFLKQSAGVLLEGRYLEPELLELVDEYPHEWLHLQWEELHEGEVWQVEVAFNEEDNQKVKLHGSTLTLVNTDGEEEELTLLQEWVPLIK